MLSCANPSAVRCPIGMFVAMVLIGASWLPLGHAQESLPDAEVAWFEQKVRPILVERCYECHAGSETQGGLRLDSKPGWMRGGDHGASLAPGDPESSLLIRAIRYRDRELEMPPSGRLPDSEIAILEAWVQRGAIDPRLEEPQGGAPALTGMSIEDGRRFWSMQPLTDPKVPTPRDGQWPQTPIDAFVLDALERQGLQPAPPASRRDLLRRMSLDLLGLLPTAQEIADFEQDTAPGSIDRCIDRLLSSPQYGVRYGRHWLDVARYADSNGLDENIAYGNAWRYRDYVVDSMNRDKPFDRFIEEQIAGDLLPGADRETTTGTGFLVLGAKVLAEPDREKLIMDTIDEQIDTLGKAFLGMTLGCARCHDHKFDPIAQRDYYALAAIFRGTKTFGDSNFGAIKHWNEISYADRDELAALKTVNDAIAAKQAEWNARKSQAMQALRERVRSQAVEYLTTAASLPPDATLSQCADAGRSLGLHPRVLAYCRKHLEFHREDPLFEPWHAMVKSGDVAGIAKHYGELFSAATAAWEALKKENAQATRLEDERLESARQALQDPSGFLAIPAKMEHALDDAVLAPLHESATELRLMESAAADETAVMGVCDRGVVDGLPLHIRGNHRQLGESIERDFPAVMRDPKSKPVFSKRSSGRLELARWLTQGNHPLTARVAVNRIWRWHFGRGLVATTENFGVLGEPPSHPELLDHLARWFMESGWSVKELHRLILSSSVYQMSTYHPNASAALILDPENRSLWRFRSQRLSAEQIRDCMFQVAGRLDLRMGGKSVPLRNRQFVFDHTSIDHTRYDSSRRTMYLPIIRNHLFTLLEQFDFPDPTMPVGDRQATTVAPQSLLLMNADWVLESAERLASESESQSSAPEARIEWLYQQALQRAPTDREKEQWLEFLNATDPALAAQPRLALTLLAQNLLISNEFFDVR